jgi:flavin reductase (DIM6/NTAB) family NADH-FMN oxidoreductase RutF
MPRRALEDLESLRLLNGGPVALLTTAWRTKNDVMPVIWHTPLSRVPPLIGVVVHPSRQTHDMIRFSEQFALNFPARDMLNHTQYFGVVSGENVGKLELSKLATRRASQIDAPLIESCVAWIECALQDSYRVGDHTLFVGQVLVTEAEEDAFDSVWRIEDPDYRPLHYLGSDLYATLHDKRQAELRTGDDGAIELAETPDEREEREEREAREREFRQREGLDEQA